MSSSIKLTITGASGVGKSTLAQLLAKELGIPLIPELARELCLQLGYEQIGNIPDQEGFKRLVLDKQIETEAAHASFIADRSVIDCWVLWQRWNICQAMTYDTEAVYDKVATHAKSYSHILYAPPLFKPVEDKFRWTEPDYIKQIDRIIRMTLHDLDLWKQVLTLRSVNQEERLQEVKSWLDAKQGQVQE